MTLEEYLQDFPWEEKWTQKGLPVNYFFTITLPGSKQDVWDVISDTSEVNKRMKLPTMHFHEKDGIVYGHNKMAGVNQEWVEAPWQWEEGRFLLGERIYSKGLAHYMRGHFIIEEKSSIETYVHVFFGMIPTNIKNRLLFQFARDSFARKMTRVMNKIMEEQKQESTSSIDFRIDTNINLSKTVTDSDNKSWIDNRRIDSIRESLKIEKINQEIFDTLTSFIIKGSNNDLYRMRPKVMARRYNVDEQELINVMLHATRAGLLNMTWDIICPHCQGVRERANHLWDVRKTGSCEVCKIDFETTGLNAIEISFYPNPDIRKVEKVLYCSAEPAKKDHIKFQRELNSQEQTSYIVPYMKGRYRMRILGEKTYNTLDVQPDSEKRTIVWDDQLTGQEISCGHESVIIMENRNPQPITFIIDENKADADALRPRDIFNIQEFRDIFSDESLAVDLSLEVGIQNIVFVDVVRSTELYQLEGNTRAFSLMRHYFQKSHDIARQYNGAIVKTMGDAVILTFSRPIDALRSSLRFVTYFDGKKDETPLKVRITINRGSCLAVNLNSSIDYFGQPVNIVAKLQSHAGGGEIAFTEEFIKVESVQEYLKNKGFNFEKNYEAQIKGAGTVRYWKITAQKKEKEAVT